VLYYLATCIALTLTKCHVMAGSTVLAAVSLVFIG